VHVCERESVRTRVRASEKERERSVFIYFGEMDVPLNLLYQRLPTSAAHAAGCEVAGWRPRMLKLRVDTE